MNKVLRRTSAGGAWVRGTIEGLAFDALVFPEHAEREDFELGTSRISKLWLKNLYTGKCEANFDRGWDVVPTCPKAADATNALAAHLAGMVF